MGFFSKSVVKEIPQRPYAYIITQFHIDPDFAYAHLRCVEEQDKAKKLRKYLVFDLDSIPKELKIEGYASLDAHPELVLYEGYVTDDGKVVMTKKEPAPSVPKS